MTKQELQKELLEKVKPGTKPSDIKKQKVKNTKPKTDEGYESDKSNKSIPKSPPLPNNQLALQKQIELHQEIKKADEKKITKLETKLQTIINLAGKEKEELQQKITEQDKTQRKKQGKTQARTIQLLQL